jgi:hypothetical protein
VEQNVPMDASDFADEELERWQAALLEQRQAEIKAEDARRRGDRAELARLLRLADKLRVRADLQLAEAVSLKCTYRQSLWAKLKGEGDASS